SGFVSRVSRAAASMSVTSFEPTLKTYTVSAALDTGTVVGCAAVAGCAAGLVGCTAGVVGLGVGGGLVGVGAATGAHAAARIVSAEALALRSSVRRVRPPPSSTQRPLPSTTGTATPQLGAPQSAGPQCEGGFAVRSGLTILPAMPCLPTLPRQSAATP